MELFKVCFVILAAATITQALPRQKRQDFDWNSIAAEVAKIPTPEQQQNLNNAGPVPFPETRPVSEDQDGDTPMTTRPPFVTRRTTTQPPSRRPPQNPINNQPPAPTTTTTTASPQYLTCMDNCKTTFEYNPVCGSDRITYPNEGRMKCAQRCGQTVEKLFGGACSRS